MQDNTAQVMKAGAVRSSAGWRRCDSAGGDGAALRDTSATTGRQHYSARRPAGGGAFCIRGRGYGVWAWLKTRRAWLKRGGRGFQRQGAELRGRSGVGTFGADPRPLDRPGEHGGGSGSSRDFCPSDGSVRCVPHGWAIPGWGSRVPLYPLPVRAGPSPRTPPHDSPTEGRLMPPCPPTALSCPQ